MRLPIGEGYAITDDLDLSEIGKASRREATKVSRHLKKSNSADDKDQNQNSKKVMKTSSFDNLEEVQITSSSTRDSTVMRVFQPNSPQLSPPPRKRPSGLPTSEIGRASVRSF